MGHLPLMLMILAASGTAEGFSNADVPMPRFTFEPGTIHVTITQLRGMSLAAIHLSVNDPVHGTQPGRLNKDLSPTKGGPFVTSVHHAWQTGDVIYYWVYVIVNGLGYQRLEQRHTIRATNAGPPPRGPFEVPTPRFHFTPHVITVTVPALPGISLAAIHLSLNVPVPGTQAGKYNQDLGKSGDVFTTMIIADWKKGDNIHYWVYVVYEGLGRHKLAQQFVIETGPDTAEPSLPQPRPTAVISNLLPEHCGTRFIDEFGDFSLRVVNSTPVDTANYPWQVQIQTITSEHVCGGIIISDRHILTAAHCLTSRFPRDLQVVVGQNDLSKKDNEEEVFAVKALFSHIEFYGGANGGRYSNDIAVLLLRTINRGKIAFGDYVRPACLPADDMTEEFTACLVSGWGRTSTELHPTRLHGTEIPYVSSDYCASPEVWGNNFNGTRQLCAGDTAGGRDACEGDSGGPLACQDSRGKWMATGIVSWGSDDCGNTPRVGVYTRVSSYVDWIVNVLENVLRE